MSHRFLMTLLLVLLFDQTSKLWVLNTLETRDHMIALTSYLNIVLVFNDGISFGLLSEDIWWKRHLLIFIALAICFWLALWVRHQFNFLAQVGAALIIGGAVGNVIDRFYQPGVIDFLDFHYNGWHWYTFNVADAAISLGVFFLILDGLFGRPAVKR